jgi:hypothetical protein
VADRPPARERWLAREPVADSGEAREVAVVADDLGAVLDGEGRARRLEIGHQLQGLVKADPGQDKGRAGL